MNWTKISAVTILSSIGMGCTPHTVPAGHVGVQTDWGAVQQEVFPEGLYWQPPGTSYIDMDARVQKKKANSTASSKDLQVVTVIIALNYRLNGEQAVEIFQNIGSLRQVESTILDPVLQEAVKTATARYNAEELITKRREVKEAITEYVRERLKASNLSVTDLSIVNFEFDDKYQDAIEAKQVAEQKALTATNDLRRIEVEAKQREARATGEANAMLIQARAEAERQELLRRTMTPELVQWQAIQKWNGQMPVVTGGGNSLVDIGSITGSK
jgi:regulator of protease activity HflC (stomatin/prohibitin superfamily)